MIVQQLRTAVSENRQPGREQCPLDPAQHTATHFSSSVSRTPARPRQDQETRNRTWQTGADHSPSAGSPLVAESFPLSFPLSLRGQAQVQAPGRPLRVPEPEPARAQALELP